MTYLSGGAGIKAHIYLIRRPVLFLPYSTPPCIPCSNSKHLQRSFWVSLHKTIEKITTNSKQKSRGNRCWFATEHEIMRSRTVRKRALAPRYRNPAPLSQRRCQPPRCALLRPVIGHFACGGLFWPCSQCFTWICSFKPYHNPLKRMVLKPHLEMRTVRHPEV